MLRVLPEYSYVRLLTPFGALPARAEGTIVLIRPETHTYVVESFAPIRAIETVKMDTVEPAAEMNAVPTPRANAEPGRT